MKFTKEDVRKELSTQIVAKGEKLSLSDRSINEQLDTLIPLLANEETELADFISAVVPIFKTTNANIRNDVSVGIKEYQEQNPAISGKPTKTDDPDTEVEKRLKALEEELNAAKSEKRISDIKHTIIAKMKEKGVKDDEWSKNMLAEITIGEDFDVEAKVDSYVNLYNKAFAKTPDDITPKGTGGSTVNKQLNDTIKAASDYAKSIRR